MGFSRFGRSVLGVGAAVVVLAGCGGAQSALSPFGPIQQNANRSNLGAPAANPVIPFDIYNGAARTIHLSSEVLPPVGQGGCPWVTYYPTLIFELVSDTYMFPPGGPDFVSYNLSCSPFNEATVWSFSLGTDISNPTKICSGSVSFTGQIQLKLSVRNTPQTDCTFQYTTVDGYPSALFTYNAAPSARANP
jgi:hypothetical protein